MIDRINELPESDMTYTIKANHLLFLVTCLTLFSLSLGTGPTSVCSVFLIVAWLFSVAWYKNYSWWLQRSDWLIPLLLVMALPWLSLTWTVAPNPKLYPYLQRTHFWLLSLTSACLIIKYSLARYISLSLIAGVQINVLLFLFFKVGLVIPYLKLYNFMEQGRITFSLLLALSIALLSFHFKKAIFLKHRIIIICCLLVNVIVLALQTGRSGYLAFFAIVPLVIRNIIGTRRNWLIILSCLLLIGIVSMSPVVQQRLNMIRQDVKEYTRAPDKAYDSQIGARFTLWRGAIHTFMEYPILGAGIDGYPTVMKHIYPKWNAPMTNPHNYYLYVAASYGILGVFLHLWLLIVVLKKAWLYRERWNGFMLFSVLLVVSVGSLTESTPLLPQTGILLAIMVGLPLDE